MNKSQLQQNQMGLRMRHQVQSMHFVGIGGAGMCGIAEVMLSLGYRVSGSDLSGSEALQRLQQLGVQIFIGHRRENIVEADVVVASSAVPDDNVELLAATEQRIPIVQRAEMLAEIMRFRHGIAVAGTHGKTTTTSLIASVLAEGGFDPTYVVGGLVNSIGAHGRLGESPALVVEADESDASFLHLQPIIAVLTNLEADHLENYASDFEKLQATYLEFIHNLPFYGLAVICFDDPCVRSLSSDLGRRFVSYGFNEEADYVIRDYRTDGMGCRFAIQRISGDTLEVELAVGGRHNACNAAAAIVIAAEEGVKDDDLLRALANFRGVSRRFEVSGPYDSEGRKITLVDDYGHHPTEIAVTLERIAETWPGRRLVLIFQPHRYSRLSNLYEDFVKVLSAADVLFILETYSAGEKAIEGADSRTLCRSIRSHTSLDPIFVPTPEETAEMVCRLLRSDDIVLVQGAGSVASVATDLKLRLGSGVAA